MLKITINLVIYCCYQGKVYIGTKTDKGYAMGDFMVGNASPIRNDEAPKKSGFDQMFKRPSVDEMINKYFADMKNSAEPIDFLVDIHSRGFHAIS